MKLAEARLILCNIAVKSETVESWSTYPLAPSTGFHDRAGEGRAAVKLLAGAAGTGTAGVTACPVVKLQASDHKLYPPGFRAWTRQ